MIEIILSLNWEHNYNNMLGSNKLDFLFNENGQNNDV